MSKINWGAQLGWGDDQIEDIRNTGYAYVRQGKYEIALPLFEALIVLEPNNPYNAQTVGAIYLQLGKAEESIKALDIALKMDTDHAPTLLNFTKALFMLGRHEDGLKLANILKNEKDMQIANVAKALILAYGTSK